VRGVEDGALDVQAGTLGKSTTLRALLPFLRLLPAIPAIAKVLKIVMNDELVHPAS
jgi:hypothetical protein